MSTQDRALVRAVASAFEADGALARSHPGFSVRAGQRRMAEAVAEAIEEGEVLVAEAGTGTGKTFAYLVPAVLCGRPVLVSTGTRNLQDQLYSRDLPRVCEALGAGLRTALLKGRANYVCRHHLRRNLSEGRFERREDEALLHRIERFAAQSATGDRSQAEGIPEDAPAWAMATSTRENCLGQECPDLADCFVFRARQAAQQADVVVVNHHLLCADLALRDEGISELLPRAGAVVFDEAHQFPEIAVQFFGHSISSRQLGDFARDLLRIGLADAPDATNWVSTAGALEQAVRDWRLAAGRSPSRRDAPQLRADAAQRAALAALLALLEAIDTLVQAAAPRSRDLSRLALRAAGLRRRLADWLRALERPPASLDKDEEDDGEDDGEDDEPDAVLWGEVLHGGVTLHATPLSVAPAMRRHRETNMRSCIFVSATLSVAGDFSHFTEALGMGGARTLAVESPFDYASNGRLLVPRGCGDPNAEGYAERIAAICWPMIAANRGRAFVLCTSLRMVERLAGLLAARAAGAEEAVELLVQGRAPRAMLLERFRVAAQPVLVGSASFWEGVDVVGQQLSLVIIDKLPFAPPDDPVLRARIEAVRRRGGDPFREIQLPAAALALEQGAGRLIRSEGDRGLLVVCDERLVTRGYGRSLVRSLPPFGFTRDADEALAWLAGAAAGKPDRRVSGPGLTATLDA